MNKPINRGDVKLAYDRAVAHDVPDVADLLVTLAEQRDELLALAEEVRRTGDTRLASMAIAAIASVKGF